MNNPGNSELCLNANNKHSPPTMIQTMNLLYKTIIFLVFLLYDSASKTHLASTY